MEFHVVIPVLISFAISLVLGPIVIPFLRRLKMGQTERELGVQSHLKNERYPYYGWSDLSHCNNCNITVLYQRLSDDHPGTFPDTGIWTDRISG